MMYIAANESWYIWICQEGCLEWCMGDLHQYLKRLVLKAWYNRMKMSIELFFDMFLSDFYDSIYLVFPSVVDETTRHAMAHYIKWKYLEI